MVFPLTERYEAEVDEMIRHEKIEEKVVGDLPVVGPAKYLKCIYKSPSVRVELRRRHLKSVEYLDLKVGEEETQTNVAEETLVQHHVIGPSFSRARSNTLVGINTFSLI
jgi:hypothetical protein